MPGNTQGVIGADWYEENIANCNTSVIETGEIAIQEPGNMMGPTVAGLQALMDRDPGARWDYTNNTYVSSMNPSPRVFPIPLYDPEEYALGKKTGRNATLHVAGFLGFFLENISGNEAYGRIFPITGVSAATSPTPTAPLAYVIRLVQ
jgi:hypothetical protein